MFMDRGCHGRLSNDHRVAGWLYISTEPVAIKMIWIDAASTFLCLETLRHLHLRRIEAFTQVIHSLRAPN
jgi:hypothetical protein